MPDADDVLNYDLWKRDECAQRARIRLGQLINYGELHCDVQRSDCFWRIWFGDVCVYFVLANTYYIFSV